ncbi:MFS general substrate transporter [Gloeopeniophorella convolvens]|nr:MFS general substrate transporter [Gloeopeniophorella convolvens]
MSTRDSENGLEEETPLLTTDDGIHAPRPAKTPLPLKQVLPLLSLDVVEYIVTSSIMPYVNQMVRELPGVDERSVGYYSGMIVSVLFAGEAVAVLFWSRLSDRIGRKPVLLVGVAGMIIPVLLFGLSRSFWALLMTRCLVGLVNGNGSVIKSTIVELTDETNVALGFSLLPVAWAVGVTIGPFLGGFLARPQVRWPTLFGHSFWAEYPYFLPAAAASVCVAIAFVVVAASLEETLPSKKASSRKLSQMEDDTSTLIGSLSVHESAEPLAILSVDHSPSLRALLTKPVLLSVANYAMLSLLEISLLVLQPLIYSTPISLGGLGMAPAAIGTAVGLLGIPNAFQFTWFPPAVARFGPRRVFIAGVASFLPAFVLFPLANLAARQGGPDSGVVWTLVGAQLGMTVLTTMPFGCIYMYVSSAAPTSDLLGATNGLAQTVVSAQRAIGPAVATALFAFSLEHEILGGNGAYVVFAVFIAATLWLAVQLPPQPWRHQG